MTGDVTDFEVDRSRCVKAAWPEGALLDHYERHARRDPRIRSVAAYERMARDTIPKGHIFWYKHADVMKIGFYNDRKKILVAVTSDQSRILTCMTQVQINYVEDLFYTEGAGVLVDWPNCPFYWEVPNYG
jgi:hypothetical protein